METQFDSNVFTLDITLGDLEIARQSRPDDALAFDALKLHLTNVRENGALQQAMEMAARLGAACLGHSHQEAYMNSIAQEQEQASHRHMDGHSHDTDKKKDKKKKKKPTNKPQAARTDSRRPAKTIKTNRRFPKNAKA